MISESDLDTVFFEIFCLFWFHVFAGSYYFQKYRLLQVVSFKCKNNKGNQYWSRDADLTFLRQGVPPTEKSCASRLLQRVTLLFHETCFSCDLALYKLPEKLQVFAHWISNCFEMEFSLTSSKV